MACHGAAACHVVHTQWVRTGTAAVPTFLPCHRYRCAKPDGTRVGFITPHPGHWGSWSGMRYCRLWPETQFISGFQLRVMGARGWASDDYSATTAQVRCTGRPTGQEHKRAQVNASVHAVALASCTCNRASTAVGNFCAWHIRAVTLCRCSIQPFWLPSLPHPSHTADEVHRLG